jgi:putative NADH-flavin reductase
VVTLDDLGFSDKTTSTDLHNNNMSPTKPLQVGIIGPTGFGGSYLTVELINRGHTVIGISRNPEKLGKHERYIPRPVDIDTVSISELAEQFNGIDVLVSEYGPHTAGADALLYSTTSPQIRNSQTTGANFAPTVPFLETVRKLILAVKRSAVSYFLFVGGAGSLHVPGTDECCVDHPDFFMAYRRAIATSEAHIAYMEERLGVMGTALRAYRLARIAERENRASEEDLRVIREYEASIKAKDRATDFIKAGRTAYMFFDGNTSFQWSFVSPSALYRPGKRTGKYEVSVDDMVLVGEQKGDNVFEGRLTGISVADMAIAIADEVENRRLVWKHWSAWGDIEEDKPAPAYVTLDDVEK